MSQTVTCYPNSDVLNSGTLHGAATYHDAFAQDPHDGDATHDRTVNGGTNICGFDLSPVPVDATVLSVAVRWAEAGTSSDTSTAQAGLWNGASSRLGPLRLEGAHTYVGFDESFPVNPFTGQPWTRAALAALMLQHDMVSCPLELGYPRLTQLVLRVTFDPRRPVGGAQASGGGQAIESGSSPSAGGSSASPRLSGSGGARGLASAVTPSAAASGSALSASGAQGRQASAAAAGAAVAPSTPGPTATASSSAPRAILVSITPTAGGS